MIDKDAWDEMMHCCKGDYNQLAFCNVTDFVYLDQAGNVHPRPDANPPSCGNYMF